MGVEDLIICGGEIVEFRPGSVEQVIPEEVWYFLGLP